MTNKNINSRVIHFELQADDIDRAKNFYNKLFGWKIEPMMTADKGGMDYWGITTGADGMPGINGGLYKRTPEKKINTYDCTILVNDIDQAIKDVKDNGGKIRQEKTEMPGFGFFAGGTDTEGNVFGLMQPTNWQVH